ncbi:MAG: hypothetical protein ACE5O2_05190 [Armatimonadota bacterium]
MNLRHAHVLVIPTKPKDEMRATLHAIRASIGYPDALSYRLVSPSGALLQRGTVPVEQTAELRFNAPDGGVYLLELDPQRNACALSGVRYAIDVSDAGLLQVIKESAPIHFRVPAGLKRFALSFNGEAASAKVLSGDGRVVRDLELPQYASVRTEINVPAGQDGEIWSLRLELTEDQAVTFDPALRTVVSPWPEVLTALETAGQREGFVRFDGTLFPEEGLFAARRDAAVVTLKTDDGLSLVLSRRGRVARVEANGRQLSPSDDAAAGGFFVRDVASGETALAAGTVKSRGATAVQVSNIGALDLQTEATFAATPNAIDVLFRVRDLTNEDRILTLYFGIPIARERLVWWDDIYTSRQVIPSAEFGNFHSGPFGANGKWSAYPFATVCQPDAAVALAVPLDRPRLIRLAYNARVRMLFVACDVALVPETRKFPSEADFSFRIYTHEPEWGFRAAAQAYYDLFPEPFSRRVPRYGGWVCWGTLEGMPGLRDYGFLYHWGGSGANAAKFDDAAHIYSFLYNDSVRFFADIGQFDHRPTRDEANAVFEQYLNAEDPAAFVLSRPKTATGRARYVTLQRSLGEAEAAEYLKRCVAAVKRSAATAADGKWVPGYVINRKDWGPENWWTGRLYCNPDPDIPGGYGQFLFRDVLGRTFAEYRKQGAELDGVGLDNFFVNALSPDCRRDHFAYVDHPLTFLHADLVPVILGDFALYEWVHELRGWLGPDRYVIANTGRMPFPFNIGQLDINGYEWNIERMGPIARTMSFRKPVVTLPVKDEHYTEAWIKGLVPLGFFPGGYGNERFKTDEGLRALYRKYVAVIHRLNEAGWKPITNARSSTPSVRLERFGRGDRILLTAHNTGDERAATTVTFKPTKPPEGAAHARELLSGEDLPVRPSDGGLTFRFALDAGDVAVVELAF